MNREKIIMKRRMIIHFRITSYLKDRSESSCYITSKFNHPFERNAFYSLIRLYYQYLYEQNY